MSTNTPKRPDESNTSTTSQQPEQHQQSTSGQTPGTGATGSQQSTGSMPPTQGTGSTPQSHTARPSSAETGAQHVMTGSPAQAGAMDRAADAAKGAIGGTQDHGTVKTPQGANVSTPGHGPTTETHDKAGDAKSAAQEKAGDLKEQAQTKIAGVQAQAQDTLESVKANLQTRAEVLRGTVTGKTDQLVGTVGEKGDLAKQTANEKSTQAGEKLTGLAGSLREKTQTLEPDNPVANVATKAAGALEQTGAYLQQSTPDDWMGDLKQLISRKPIESVLVAAGLGYMAARAFRK